MDMVSRRSFIGSVAGVAIAAGVGGYLAGNMPSVGAKQIDPVLGFTGLTAQTAPPRQADHNVRLTIAPRPPVPIPEFYFEPAGLFIQPGQTIRFAADTPHHSVSAFHPEHGRMRRVPEGVPAFSSPVLPIGSYWLYTFEKEGVYDLFCGPHEYFGMVMRVVAGSATGPGTTAVPPPFPLPGEEEPLPPLLTGALILSDPALNPINIMGRGSVNWADLAPESKRPLLAPAEG